MKIGAYSFVVTDDIPSNMEAIQRGVSRAAEQSVRLLVFPECALTGYPKGGKSSSQVDMQALEACFAKLQQLSAQYGIYLLVGSVTRKHGEYHNSAILFSPNQRECELYHKRALWGWDRDNFSDGSPGGVWTIDGVTVGVRICFEVRFPEYFRELYREKAKVVLVMFNDVSEIDDLARYELIKAHLRTRAVENVCTVISVNDASYHQTAPTAVIHENGEVIAELSRHTEELLVYDYQPAGLSFGAEGRKTVSDRLTKRPRCTDQN